MLQAFAGPWQLHILRVPPSPDTASDRLQPLLVVAASNPDAGDGAAEPPIKHSLEAAPGAPNEEQLAGIIQVFCQTP